MGLTSCATTTETVTGDDRSAFCLSARARVPFGARAPGSSPAARGDTSTELWIDLAGASGSDSQDVALGNQVVVDGVALLGPARVESELELRQLTVSVAQIAQLDASLLLALTAGVGLVERDLHVRANGLSLSERAHAFACDVGVELDWRAPAEPLLVYGRLHAGLAVGSDSGSGQSVFELGLGWVFDPHFVLRAGWRHWTWSESLDTYGSDVDYVLSGPVVALDVRL